MKQILLLFSILLLLASCDNDELPQSDVPFALVGKGDSFSNGQSIAQRHLVIKDAKTWNNFKKEMNITSDVAKGFKEMNIDFSQYQVIAVIDKTQPNDGHSIDIVEMTENRNTIIVKVEKLKNGNLTKKPSKPYDIVKTAKTDKKVVFEQ
ncbi:protease complex subunit PrcB family protein [Flavobacterium tistrianum]|uniref:protease complex subunit PrcB family protein n=1 Tax=Flavobacterium tistrianum TaxID=1685414 RepID=UPI000DAF41BD|nr:protease complex subunit PrcB family protein [Flavobacterium tistrianum]KAF2339165.1 protease complex subunit PrcB family protein [Flavobacterium tistrianum]